MNELVKIHDEVIDDLWRIRTLELHRPEARNPLDHGTVNELSSAVEAAQADRGVRALVITGNGPAFSAGGDLKKYLDLYARGQDFRAFLEDFREMCYLLERGRLLTCAMVNGTCVAGGLELALACDFITIAADAKIGDGHVGSGQIPGGGGSQRLCHAIGVQRARDLLLTGRMLEADEAHRIGLVHRVFDSAELEAGTMDFLASVGRHSPLATYRMKQLIGTAMDETLQAGLDEERELVFTYATSSHDAKEGLTAFLERRPNKFLGR